MKGKVSMRASLNVGHCVWKVGEMGEGVHTHKDVVIGHHARWARDSISASKANRKGCGGKVSMKESLLSMGHLSCGGIIIVIIIIWWGCPSGKFN